jgi:GATA-type transcription activator-like protein
MPSRRHILRDLSPYTCFVETCTFSSALFGSRKLWSDHLIHQHPDLDMWTTFTCPLCSKSMAGQQQALLSDIANHLEEISLSALPQDVSSNDSDYDHSDASSASTALSGALKAGPPPNAAELKSTTDQKSDIPSTNSPITPIPPVLPNIPRHHQSEAVYKPKFPRNTVLFKDAVDVFLTRQGKSPGEVQKGDSELVTLSEEDNSFLEHAVYQSTPILRSSNTTSEAEPFNDTLDSQVYRHPDHQSSHLEKQTPTSAFASPSPKRRRGRAAPPGRCQSCNRTESPEWRRGPSGARTLCNACGLHYAKLMRKMGTGSKKPIQNPTSPDPNNSSYSHTSPNPDLNHQSSQLEKQTPTCKMDAGSKVSIQNSTSQNFVSSS